MPRIKIKDKAPNQGNRKSLLWNRLMNLNLLIYNIKEPNKYTFVLITSDEVVEKLLTSQIKEKLKNDHFEIVTPPEYSANRTMVLRNVDSLITTIENEDLKSDLERRNEWLKVTEIIKIPNAPKIIKIRTETTEMIKKATETGVLIWNQSIPPNNIQKEVFVYLDLCYKCYAFTHKTEECQTPNIVICSECAEATHRYKDCTATTKKCLNCQGDHRTLAAKCPIRKNLIKEKQKEIRERSRSRSRSRTRLSYAQATAGTTEKEQKATATSLSREDQVKIESSISYAFKVEGILPGTFNRTVKEMYRLNNLPQVRFPDYIPPPNVDKEQVQEEINKMIRAFERASKQDTKESEDEEQMEEETTRKRNITPSPNDQRQPKSRREEDTETDDEGAVALTPIHYGSAQSLQSEPTTTKAKTTQSTMGTKSKPVDTRLSVAKYEKHVGQMKFCFIKTKETIVKKKEDPKEISQLIKEGKMKYVYANPEYSEADCRFVWEKGYVNLQTAEFRNVPREMYNEVEYNGKFLERRASLTGAVRKK